MTPQELFARFLKNECSIEEKQQLMDYLQEHPEELDNYLPLEEFMQIDSQGKTDPELHDRMFRNVKRTIFPGNLRRLYIKRLVAAAAVIACLFAGFRLFRTSTDNPDGKDSLSTGKAIAVNTHWERINTGSKPMQLVLPDSSLVLLAANSTVSYDGVFGENDQRAINLSGEARFDVKKDARRPFTVYSGDISITALGTSFNVKAYDNANIISVYLMTGKVVIKPADTVLRKLKENMFLKPGETLFYNKTTWQASIRKAVPEKTTTAGLKRDILMPAQKPDWYMFDNQPLAEVLDQLSYYYGVKIVYTSRDLRNKYLTAKFQATDSLSKILKDIALLNRLSVVQTSDSYTVSLRTH